MIPPIFLDKIKTVRYGNKILLGIDLALIELVNSDKIEFQSVIQDGKYVLIGPKIIGSMMDQPKPGRSTFSFIRSLWS